jgi:hypothetical protein
MAQTTYTFQKSRATILSTGLNSLFSNLETASSTIDADNTRTECLTRNHISEEPNIVDDYLDSSEETYGGQGFGTSAVTIYTLTDSIPVSAGQVLRVGFNPLVTTTTESGGASVIVRAQSSWYLRFYVTVGGVDVAIGPWWGYSHIIAGSGTTGTSTNKQMFYERLPLTALYLPNTDVTVTAIKVKVLFDDPTNFSVNMVDRYGWYHLAKF